MDIEETHIPGVLILRPRKFEDGRGFLSPIYRREALEERGVTHGWVQNNRSLSHRRGMVRDIYCQNPPHAQAKLVRVIRGAAMDLCKDRPAHDRRYAIDASRIRSELGWVLAPTLDRGLRETFSLYLDHETRWRLLRDKRHAGHRIGPKHVV